jgi:hypothetical protein
MRAARLLLLAAGAVPMGYGGWLLWPHLPTAAVWLLAGPAVNDTLIAPLVGLTGLALARTLPAPLWRRSVAVGSAITAVLVLIAVPLVLRPHAAAPNPGLQDRDHVTGLAWWIGGLWIGIALAAAGRRYLHRRRTDRRPGRADPGSADPGSAPLSRGR